MNEIQSILKHFSDKYISKEKRERTRFLLNNLKKRDRFIEKINHEYDIYLNLKQFHKLNKEEDRLEIVKLKLNLKDDEKVLVLSDYSNLNFTMTRFDEAISEIYGSASAGIIIDKNCKRIYVETEMNISKPDRFISK